MSDPARFRATGRDALRRLRHRLPPRLGGLLILICIWGPQARAEPPDPPKPPPFERLLPPAAPPGVDAMVFCRKQGGACADNLSLDGAQLYRRVRKLWRPPDNTIVTTTVWFGADARDAAADGAEANTISVALELDPRGGLRRPPRTLLPDRIGFAAAVVDELLYAIERGQPYDMFPSTEFERWKDVLLRLHIEQR